MLNGRWVPSDEIFEGISPMMPSPAGGPTTEMAVQPAAAASALPVLEEPDKQKRAANPLKELRFRQVLLSQTDHELSLIQVRCLVLRCTIQEYMFKIIF
jgi:hypothetical protein